MPRFHVQRSIDINATPESVFETVADYGTWKTWSPWLCAEPDAEVTVTDDPSSVGSIYSWSGEIVGAGEIEHRQLESPRVIEDELRFTKPFRSQSRVVFKIEPAGEGAKITWHMHGSLPWFLFWMIPQMEIFVGMDYQRGLRMLKELLETGQILSKTTIQGVDSVGPLRMAGVRKTCSVSDVGPSMEAAFSEATQKFQQAGLSTDGEGITVYHKFDLKAQTFDYTSGFLLPDSAGSVPADLTSWSIPHTKVLRTEHIGSCDNLGNAWSAANQYVRYKKLKQSKILTFEIYKNDPHETSPADLRTEIYLPLK